MLDLLRADEMDVAVETARGEDFALAGNDVGAGTDDDGDAGLDVGIAGLADGADIAFLDGDVGLHDPPVVDDQRIGDDGVGRALLVGDLRLPHAVADYLAAAEFHLLAIDGEVLFDLDDQIRVGQPHPVAGGGPEHVGIDGTFYLYGHHRAPSAEVFPRPLRGRVREGGAAAAIVSREITTSPSRRHENRRRHACRRAPRVARRASARARSGPRCRRRYRAACRELSCGRTSAPDWSRRNDSASRPGSDDRPSWRR